MSCLCDMHVCGCTILYMFVCVYIFICVCLSPLCFSAYSMRVYAYVLYVWLSLHACVHFQRKVLEVKTWPPRDSCSYCPPPAHLTHHQRSWEKGSAGSMCMYMRVCFACVCVCNVDDGLGSWGVAGLQCCCQDKQLRLCLGQVFHSDSAHWN